MGDNKDTEEQTREDYIDLSDEIYNDFKNFLDEKGNSRIFFSASYGLGKTSFLKEFFEKYEEEYEVFYLHPINYQIAHNDNVFEFLKYDLLVKLLNREPKIFRGEDEESRQERNIISDAWQNLGKNGNQALDVAAGVGSTIILTTTGIPIPPNVISEPIKNMRTAYHEIDSWYYENQENTDKNICDSVKSKLVDQKEDDVLEKDIFEYIDNLENKPAAHEPDVVSAVINQKIKSLSEDKTSVLVIDDFDRMDPEHILRLLNVLTAYAFRKEDQEEAKFGFDKIILVGDRKNIKSIFYHQYGANVDFKGYFDKFTSKRTYTFDNQTAVKHSVEEILRNIKSNEKIASYLEGSNGLLQLPLQDIFLRSLEEGVRKKINLRDLNKLIDYEFVTLNENPPSTTGAPLVSWKYSIQLFIRLLYELFEQDKDEVLTLLKEIRDNIDNSAYRNSRDAISLPTNNLEWINQFLTLLDKNQIPDNGEKITISINGKKYNFNDENNEYDTEYLFYDLCIEAFQQVDKVINKRITS